MGKLKGFIDIERQKAPARPIGERLSDWNCFLGDACLRFRVEWRPQIYFLTSSSFGCGCKLSVVSCAGSDYRTKITFYDFDMTMQTIEE